MILVKKFHSQIEAQFALDLLISHGIEARIDPEQSHSPYGIIHDSILYVKDEESKKLALELLTKIESGKNQIKEGEYPPPLNCENCGSNNTSIKTLKTKGLKKWLFFYISPNKRIVACSDCGHTSSLA
jgi:predicted nucleic-acid-binding Zn-ribbon protein